jgi:UDP-N-acetylmuramate: L-alanyl-gamma-D-glutamyl-meso-diaminopimelate ligase
VPPERGLAALARFAGVRRRMELSGIERDVAVYDDFAHHPTAIATTIAGLRRKIGGRGRILAVLEPRSNTMKRGVMKEQLAGSLAEADRVYCHAAHLGWDVAQALSPLGEKASVTGELDALVDEVVREARASDHILVMSNGGFGGIHGKLLAALREPGGRRKG